LTPVSRKENDLRIAFCTALGVAWLAGTGAVPAPSVAGTRPALWGKIEMRPTSYRGRTETGHYSATRQK